MTASELAERAAAVADEAIDVREIEPQPEPEPGAELVRHVDHTAEHRSAVEAASEAALAMPGIPGRDEFLSLAMQARMLCLSGAAPKAVRNNPHLAFHVAMVGRDLGISPSAALELIDVIEGSADRQTGEKQYRLSLSPQLLNGQIRRLGLGSIRPRISTPQECVAVAYGPDGSELGESTFTWEDARMAGLVGAECQPGEHVRRTVSRGNRSWEACGCNQGYITYPRRMLWWRASGFCADDFFPEAGLGMYTPEALGAVVDEDGRPVDPATIELPEGYDAAEAPAETREAPASTANEPAPEEERDAIKARIDRLAPPAVHVLSEIWKKEGPDGTPTLWPLKVLPNRQVKPAHALVDAIEKRAEKGEWGEWVGHQEGQAQDLGGAEAPPAPEPGPEGDESGEPTPESEPPAPAEPGPAVDESEASDLDCTHPECGEAVVIVSDEGDPWCEQHRPL